MTRVKPLPYTAAQFCAKAKTFVGTKENPPGSNKQPFGAAYRKAGHGPNGVAWCAQAVWAIHNALGVDLIDDYGFTNCQYTPIFAKDCERLGWQRVAPKDVQAGDHLFFDFPDKVRRIQHVGIAIASVRGGRVATREGNTSSGRVGSQDDGDGYYERSRRISDIKVAYRPPFAKAAPKKAAAKSVTAVVLSATVLAYGGANFVRSDQVRTVTKQVTVTKTVAPRPTVTKTRTVEKTRTVVVKVTPKQAAPKRTLNRVLVVRKPAQSGNDVAAIGKLVGAPGSRYDARMASKVKAWQKRKHLAVDGKFGCASARAAGWSCR